ncbi:hypothetical protein CkaCkLH20_06701 [Colletotrichum karsti]|uniref:Uncharacterized protein n=1 Tax=Colletotrichum karsti TaxID=1095194 RepID=A0A9P6I4A6_9PEZI|nr:uncharacterized protein CkaCkLH20_06701 [Colletotrichum karsti]KAF9875769.1 hypothetical protein CkaCkLH20_06701 [Colletotrichum karsti]
MNSFGSCGIVEYSFPMWSKQHVGNWLDAFKPRRNSRSSIYSSSSGFSSSSASAKSRSASLSSLFSRAPVDDDEPERERLVADEEPVKRKPYVPKYAARSFMRTTTTLEIRAKNEML